MNQDSKPHPLARNFLELQRKSAKGYACPLCTDTEIQIYHQEPKLWDHAVKTHRDSFGDLESTETASALRKSFRQQALDKAQNKARTEKATPPTPDAPQGRSTSDWKASSGGTDIRLRPTSGLEFPSGILQGPLTKLHDTRTLTTEQGRRGEQNDEHTNISNARLAGAESKTGSPGSPFEGDTTAPMSLNGRDAKVRSSGRHVDRGLDSSRQSSRLNDSEYRRPAPGRQPLYDPNNGNPDSIFQRSKQQGHFDSLHRSGPPNELTEQGGFGRKLDLDEAHTGGPQHTSNVLERPERPHKMEMDRRDSVSKSSSVDDRPQDPDAGPEMLLQPETRPISHEQLVVEVKGIYAGLVMVEAKCIDIDERQSTAAQEKDPSKKIFLKNDQWQSLIALHKQLLHEHHDFFLASQHPSASPALSRLAAKYSMPARMWRHGIHAFLEVLRHRLPESLEHMLAFIYIAYTMMALLYETVSTFEDTWIECLGDLGRYRMAIEDDDPKDREVWSNVAQFWYNKAADKSPTVGRLYHHLAILARPYSLEQLSLYTRSLTCIIPFESARGSIMTLFNPILHGKDTTHGRGPSLETLFIRAHAILFISQLPDSSDRFNAVVDELEKDGLMDKHIAKAASRFKETGVFAAISNFAALFEYGTPKEGTSKPRLRIAFENAQTAKAETSKPTPGDPNDSHNIPMSTGAPMSEADNSTSPASSLFITQSSRLASITLAISLARTKDRNVYPLVHVYLVFIWHLIIVQQAWADFENEIVWKVIERDMPWTAVCGFLNTIAANPQAATDKTWIENFPEPDNENGRPLTEDFVMRGQLFAQWLFPDAWFTNAKVDDDERALDLPSMAQSRMERILWLGRRIASANRWIRYDMEAKIFTTTDFADSNLNPHAMPEPSSIDEDSIMSSDDGTAYHTPRTMSVATSESHDENIQYTPRTTSVAASDSHDDDLTQSTCDPTPMDLETSDAPPEASAPMTPDVEDRMEDIAMIDISPGKGEQPAANLGEFGKPSIVSWPRDKVIDPGFSPPLVNQHGGEFIADPRKSRDLVDYDDREDAETYKP